MPRGAMARGGAAKAASNFHSGPAHSHKGTESKSSAGSIKKVKKESSRERRPSLGERRPSLQAADEMKRDFGSKNDPIMKKVETTLANIKTKTIEEIVDAEGVQQDIYMKYIKAELDSESACLELPLTILVLVSFAIVAMTSLRQEQIFSVEHGITFDITENANFAWSHTMGHKTVYDVNSIADFWSWFRLGFLPLVVQHQWPGSEEYPEAFGSGPYAGTNFSRGNYPTHWQFEGYEKPAPVRNDYLRYNRLLGGIRLQQELAPVGMELCKFPSNFDVELFEKWYGKPCTPSSQGELPPELYETEGVPDAKRIDWFFPELDSLDELQAKAIDMEDGCNMAATAEANASTCRCAGCMPQTADGRGQPWLDEQTSRAEIAMVLYNPQYGTYSYVGVNFFFNRGGTIYKFVNLMSAWADLSTAAWNEQAMLYTACVIWVGMLLNVVIGETREIIHVVRCSKDRWYRAIKNDYMAVWNVVDWVSVIVGVVVMVLYVRMQMELSRANDAMLDMMKLSLDTVNREKYLNTNSFFVKMIENVCWAEKDYRASLCLYPTVVMLRLFKSFAAQPRLALVTATLQRSAQDMLHFFIVFLSVYYCMTVNSVLFFGQDVEEFSTLFRASHACFLAMFGDWEWEKMSQVGQAKAIIWFWLFLIIMVLLLANMLLAIIMEAYTKEKQKAEDAPTLFRQIREMWRRRKQFKEGKRVRLNDIYDEFVNEYSGDVKTMLADKRMLTVYTLVGRVPGLPFSQAKRLMCKALEEHRKEKQGETTAQDVIDGIKKDLEHINQRESLINEDVTATRDLVMGYDGLEATGDPEYDYHFSQGAADRFQPYSETLATAMSSTSAELGSVLVRNVARIERWQDSFERQQNELHHLIAEMQLMVAQQARTVASLAEAATAIGASGPDSS